MAVIFGITKEKDRPKVELDGNVVELTSLYVTIGHALVDKTMRENQISRQDAEELLVDCLRFSFQS